MDVLPHARVEAALKQLKFSYICVDAVPFFTHIPAEGCFLLSGLKFRYQYSIVLILYENYILVSAFSKYFKALFPREAEEALLAKNQENLALKYANTQSILYCVFTTLWQQSARSDTFPKTLYTSIMYVSKKFMQLADSLELTSNIAALWLGASQLPYSSIETYGNSVVAKLQLQVKCELMLRAKDEGLMIKLRITLPMVVLQRVQPCTVRGVLQKINEEYISLKSMVFRRYSKKAEAKYPDWSKYPEIEKEKRGKVVSRLVSIRKYLSDCILPLSNLQDNEPSTIGVFRRENKPLSGDHAPKAYRTYHVEISQKEYSAFMEKIDEAVRELVIRYEEGKEGRGMSFRAKRWYLVRSGEETGPSNVAEWLFSLSFEFEHPPFNYLYYVENEGFRLRPVDDPDQYECFKIQKKTQSLEQLHLRVIKAAIERLKLTPPPRGGGETAEISQSLLHREYPELPEEDEIPIEKFEEKNFASCLEVGKGGFGTVYFNRYKKVIDREELYVEVAIKLIKPEKLGKRSTRESLMQEYRILKTTYHPNVIHTHGYVLYNSNLAIVLDYCKNKTLSKYLTLENSLPMQTRLQILNGVANGLILLHSRSIAHLDLKPQNVLIDEHGVPKISDLGLSRLVKDDAPISKAGYTLLYSAPEQIDGKQVDLTADIWAFGNLMYYVFFTKGPNEYLKEPNENIHSFAVKRSVVTAMMESKRKPLIPDKVSQQDIPHKFELQYPQLVDLMRQCWQLNAAARPSAQKIAKTLKKVLEEETKKQEQQGQLNKSKTSTVISEENIFQLDSADMPTVKLLQGGKIEYNRDE